MISLSLPNRPGRVFFTSDTHFSHTNILTYCPNRQFNTIQEHDETLIRNWNNVVTEEDTVFHLGDVGFGNLTALITILVRLHGHKVLIVGNHDRRQLKSLAFKTIWTDIINGVSEITYQQKRLVLSHFPLDSWECDRDQAIHLHGHCHSTVTNIKPSYSFNRLDVGVDFNDLTPLVFSEMVSKVQTLNQLYNEGELV